MSYFALYGFLKSGRGNLMAVVQAESDEVAAEKLGGRLVLPKMDRKQMVVYACRLPQMGEGWNEFKFGNDQITAKEAMKRLGEMTGQPSPEENEIGSVKNVGTSSDHLVLARTPFLEGSVME